MRYINKILLLILTIVCALFASSCNRVLGYSVVLWDIDKYQIADGTILPVYIKSNISHVYIARLPQTETNIEIPLWQLSTPTTKAKAITEAKSLALYERTYAKVKLDGLPVRFEAVNTAKQVYRLRKAEVVRVLRKVTGSPVMAGKKELEGDWLLVLMQDGTQGYCFSYNLDIYKKEDFSQEKETALEKEEEQALKLPDNVLSNRWWPKEVAAMLKSGKIDIDNFDTNSGFFPGEDGGKVRLSNSKVNKAWDYMGVEMKDALYSYKDAPLKLSVLDDTNITVLFTDSAVGKPEAFSFEALKDIDINALITKETQRREREYNIVFDKGPAFISANYGELRFTQNQGFAWRNFRALQPAILPENVAGRGSVCVKYYLSKQLASTWDGVLTFNFENLNRELNFLYAVEDTGLKLKVASEAVFDGITLQSSNPAALVMFFSNNLF